MEIRIGEKKSDYRQLGDFLSAIVVNKANFFALHLAENIEKMRRIGIQVWAETSGKKELSARYAKVKRKRGYSAEYDVLSGGTKSQATIMDGSAEVHMTGRGNFLVNISPADWKPVRGESGWHSNYNDRPFWELNKSRHFWQPGRYIDITNVDHSIWKTTPPDGEISLTDAKRLLILSTAKSKSLLNRHFVQLGSWKKGRAKGAAASWH